MKTPVSGLHFDSVLVGTSPLMLLEATRLGQAGKRIALIDRHPRLGGAWCTGTLGRFSDLEMGCHYIERNEEAYRLIESIIDGPMPEMEPQPFLIWKGFRVDRASEVPYLVGALAETLRHHDWRRLIRVFLSRTAGAISRLRGADLLPGVETPEPGFQSESVTPPSPSQTLSDLDRTTRRLPYRYPVNGCRQLIESLEKRLKGLDITVLLETNLDQVILGGSNNVICRTTGGTIESKEIVVSSCTDLQGILIYDNPITIDRSNGTQQHVILHVLGRKRRPFTYFETANHTSLMRTSDIGMYSESFRRHAGPHELMICVHVAKTFWDRMPDEDARATQVLADLVGVGVLDRDSSLVDHWCEQFDTTVIRDSELQVLEEAAAPHLRALYSYNFSVSFARYVMNAPGIHDAKK